ncbi:MAG: methylmalonyl-CoA mutase small subunit, partial [Bacteroidales bacterium]|nr:methylmalonyl-CoA mutase small subunit [Bacteroidales bacterium]
MAEKEKGSGMFEEFPPVTTQQWEEKIQADLKGADYEKKLIWKPIEGFRVRPYYRLEDLKNLMHLQALPGEYPYTRGHQENDFGWQIREDIDVADIKDTNQLALNAIKKGATSLSLNVKNVHTTEDLKEILKDIDPEKIVLNFYSPFSPWKEFLEKLHQVLHEKGSDPAKVVGSVDFDPISYALMHGDFYHGREEDLNEAADLIRFAEEKLPAFRVITINGRYFQEAGSSVVQELGYSLASANQYLADLTEAGLNVDEISRRMVFFFTTGSSYFMEIAKYRAARLLWAQIIEQYQPMEEESRVMHIHATTLNWNKTVYDPYVNMLRTTTEAMSAALGGVDSFGVTPFDRHF